jgi:hypothetical protein
MASGAWLSWLVRTMLLVTWLVTMVRGNPVGPWLHLLLVVALGSIAVGTASGRGAGATSPHPTASE